MKIVDAHWEKRNLGVNCHEILVEEKDTFSSFMENEQLLKTTEYLVLKVPVNRFDICAKLPALGFAFVEGSINFELQLKNAVLSPLQERMNKTITYAKMDISDIDYLYNEIRSGIFKTDRILMDLYFTPENAANRYVNWIADELLRDTQVYKIEYKNETIGFFTFKTVAKGIYFPFLAGMYQKFSTSGLGFTTLRKPIDEALKRGGKLIRTYVSTNNLPVVRLHNQQGFNIKKIDYVFVKHN